MCLDNKCEVMEIACDQPICPDGTFPPAIEGECCAFEECPDTDFSWLGNCKNSGKKTCESLYLKKGKNREDFNPCRVFTCEKKKCTATDFLACAQFIPECEDGSFPEADPEVCCGFMPCSEDCRRNKKKKACTKTKGCE